VRVAAAAERAAAAASAALGGLAVAPPPIFIADTADAPALRTLAGATRVLISCAGPFRFLGPPVVAACIDAKTHYVDVTGEPAFMEGMEAEHDARARAARVLVVSACGFDSIPADLGCLAAADALRKGGALPTQVESFLAIRTGARGLRGH
jgi:short subunit dehydrogenase-like uncharacterized protein